MPTPTLAQLDRIFGSNVPPLPEAPLLERLVFEQPIPLAVGLFIAGIVSLVALRNAGKVKAGLIALGVSILLIAGLMLTAGTVTTDREKLLDLQDTLVGAVAEADIGTIDGILSPGATVPPVNLSPISGGLRREQILTTVAATTGGAYRVSDYAILERQATIDGANSARTQIHLRVESAIGGPTLTWFRIAWRLDPNRGWEAIEIEPLFISGVMPYKG
jgi:hypothetical protein